jgi:hypothetical protein
MRFKDWRKWLSSRPYFFRLILYAILTKQIANLLWDVSIPGLPLTFLQFFSFLIPLIIFFSINGKSIRTRKDNGLKNTYVFWAILYLINLALILINNISLDSLKLVFKFSTPCLLFFFFTKYIISKKDLHGVLTTIALSYIPLIISFFYSVVFYPAEVYYARDLERIETFYADVASLGRPVCILLIISAYFFLLSLKHNYFKKFYRNILFFFIGFGALVLLKINHGASNGIFVVVLLLFLLILFRSKIHIALFFIAFIVIPIALLFNAELSELYDVFYGTEVELVQDYENIDDYDTAFHGRVGRWRRYFDDFSNESTIMQLFGGMAIERPFIAGHAMHNDYLRILFTTGYIGLFIYILFLFLLIGKSFKLLLEEQFLTWSLLLFIILLSITLTPSSYVDTNFFVMAVVAYMLLPKNLRQSYYDPYSPNEENET